MRTLSVLLLWLAAFTTLAVAACDDIESFVATAVPAETPALPSADVGDAARPHWDETPHYCIVQEDIGFVTLERFAAIVQDAFRSWSVEAVNDGACSGPIGKDDGVSQIGWGNTTGSTPNTDEAGETIVTWTRCHNCTEKKIIEADITIDIDPPRRFANERCLFTTVLHETGHFLGVAHLADPSAIMAPIKSSCPQELTEADLAALAALYA